MNPSDVLDFGETDLVTLTANIDAAILGEDAREDATDESGVDLEMLCHSRWRTSAFDSGRVDG